MLKEISQNYQSVSLESLAKKTNYNRSYLGTLFKNETGSPFSKALTDQRLLRAYGLLCSSNLSISSIMIQVGISNRTFFYNKFKEKFHLTPNEVRIQMTRKR
ncbi:helix-turn-helix domain-containing protein [Lactobacillus intestinalis]